MSTLTLKLASSPSERIDLSGFTPAKLAGLGTYEIAQLVVAADGATAGDFFTISGVPGDTIVFAGGHARIDGIATGLDTGTVIVEGHCGDYAGAEMTGGRLDIRGNAGAWPGAAMTGGLVTVKGSAGDFAGSARVGDKQGMAGGTIVVEGNIGERAGDRMRRGTIIARGTFGPAAGSRMMGGTLWTETGFGANPGPLLRRGTLIAPKVERMLPTFADCGWHDLNILKIINKHFAETLGALAPKPLPPKIRRFAGDLASVGKGEILLTQ